MWDAMQLYKYTFYNKWKLDVAFTSIYVLLIYLHKQLKNKVLVNIHALSD